jgi:hypothetical protein
MSEMNKTIDYSCQRKTYYVYGSGLFAVPSSRVNDISTLRSEYHSVEAKKAWALALARIHS